MSVDRPSPSTDDHDKDPKPTRERAFAADQSSIDQRLKHLKEEVLPFYPFLLTVPTDVPFRLGGHFVNNWAVGNEGPFALEEHQLQYMTFLTHHEGDSLLVAVGDWSDGAGSIMSDQRPGLQNPIDTQSNGATKKKISLNDYKNKWKGGASTSPVSQKTTTQSTPATRLPDDKQQTPKASPSQPSSQKTTNNTATNSKSPPQDTSESATGRKRLPGSESEHVKTNNKEQHPERRSAKKPRIFPDQTDDKETDPAEANGLPVLLSPTLPSLPPNSDNSNLPQLLSPTLPPSIEKELAEPTPQTLSRKGAVSTIEGLAEDRTRVASSNLDAPRSGFARSPSAQSRSPEPLIDRSNALPQAANKSFQSDVGSRQKSSIHTGSNRKLVVKLKYGKANKKRVDALLKFSGKKKTTTSLPKSQVHEDSLPASHRSEKKPKQTSNDEPTGLPGERSKERKPTASEKPQTPLHIPLQQGKSKQITPAKDLKNTTSRQFELTDSDEKTSVNHGTKHHTGYSNTKLSPPQPSGQQGRARNSERRAWKEDYQKYGNLGRELKHAADRQTAKDDVTNSDEKIAAATALEAILCFILAFVADDRSKALARQVGDSSAWISILAYWRVVKKNSASHPQLYNLCLILGAVSYDAIHALDLGRLAVSSFPGEHAANEGGQSSEESKRNRKELYELKTRLPECYKESQKLWTEGIKGLSEDFLDREFPITWRNRSRRYTERGKPPSKAGDYSGGYFLPLGKTDTPVEVVRFGWSFLKEWCSKEGLNWHGRLNL